MSKYRKYGVGAKFLSKGGPVEVIEGSGVTVKFITTGEVMTFESRGFNVNVVNKDNGVYCDWRSMFSDWVDALKAVEYMAKQIANHKKLGWYHSVKESELQLKRRMFKLEHEERKLKRKYGRK